MKQNVAMLPTDGVDEVLREATKTKERKKKQKKMSKAKVEEKVAPVSIDWEKLAEKAKNVPDAWSVVSKFNSESIYTCGRIFDTESDSQTRELMYTLLDNADYYNEVKSDSVVAARVSAKGFDVRNVVFKPHTHLQLFDEEFMYPGPYKLIVPERYWELDGNVYGRELEAPMDFNSYKLIYLHLDSHAVCTASSNSRTNATKKAFMAFLRTYLAFLMVNNRFPSRKTEITKEYFGYGGIKTPEEIVCGDQGFDMLEKMVAEMGGGEKGTNYETRLGAKLKNYVKAWETGCLRGPGTNRSELYGGAKYFNYLNFLHLNGLFSWKFNRDFKQRMMEVTERA